MGRATTIDTETILNAAREVFIEDGVQGTTAEIARRTEVSEGTLFRRFHTKEALFFECMGLPAHPDFLARLPDRVGRTSVEEELTDFMHEALTFFEDVIPKIMLMMASGAGARIIPSIDSPPVAAIRIVSNYLAAEHALGRLRPHDPEIAARMLIGTAWHYVFADIVGINEFSPMPKHTFVRGVVVNLLRGLEPETTKI